MSAQRNTETDPIEVVIRWLPEDVQTLRPELSREEAEDVLMDIGNRLEERSIELGWEVLEFLVFDTD